MKTNDLMARWSAYKKEIEAAILRSSSSGWWIQGPEVKNFETHFSNYLGAKYCISLANGTDAIELALRSMGIRSGDRVATAANAGFYTTTALLAIGAEPFFLDVDLATRNLSLDQVRRAVEAGVQAVVVTHLYGLTAVEIREIAKLCSKYSVKLLEDCAQAHGASLDHQRVGTFGDASTFSFYPTKNLVPRQNCISRC